MKEILRKRKKREKHFLKEDGTFQAQVYDYDIHFLKNGSYEEIDNTLIKVEDHFENKNNNFKVKFYEDPKKLYRIDLEDHFIEINLKNKKSSKITLLESNKNISNLFYENILDSIDLEYNLLSSELKENIILKEKPKETITFLIHTDLELSLEQNKIKAKDKEKEVFTMNVPFLYDKDQNYNRNVEYQLVRKEDCYEVSLLLDESFLEDETRYPIVIDPTITNSFLGNDVSCTFIYQGDSDVDKTEWDHLKVGTEVVNGEKIENRTLLKFELPTLGTGDQILEVRLNLENYPDSTTDKPLLEVHKITSPWQEESATWESMKDCYDSKIEEIKPFVFRDTEPNQTLFFLTNLVKEWYLGEPNYGIMIKEKKEGSLTKFYSKKNQEYKPLLFIDYRHQNGLESYIDVSTQSLSYGSMNINNYNGNVTGIFPITQTLGKNGTAALELIYNTNDVVSQKNQGCGLGFKFNYDQIIKEVASGDLGYTEYVDADGTSHYFIYISDSYKAEDGFEAELTKEEFEYTLTDKNKNKMKFFDVNGTAHLYKIIDAEGHIVMIDHDSDYKITTIKDDYNNTIDLSYGEDEITITSPQETVSLTLQNGKIKSIDRLTGSTEILYNENGLIQKVIDETGRKYSYEYYETSPYPLKKVSEYSIQDRLGNAFTFDYDFDSTTITNQKNQKTIKCFDEKGNLASTSVLSKEGDLEHAYTRKFEYDEKTNKLLSEGYPIRYVKNYCKNVSFEEGEHLFQKTGTLTLETSTDVSYSGSKSLKATGIGSIYQEIEVPKGKSYTFSAMFKTDHPILLSLSYFIGEEKVESKETILKNDSFACFDTSIDYKEEATSNLRITITSEEDGTYYMDHIQLEEGMVANECNLAENSDFSDGLKDWGVILYEAPSYMGVLAGTEQITIPEQSLPYEDKVKVVTLEDDTKALKVISEYDFATSLTKSIPIGGKAGDQYLVSFWYKNSGLEDASNASFDCDYGLAVPDEYLVKAKSLPPTRYWRYVSFGLTAIADYNALALHFSHVWQTGEFYIKDICIYKDIRNRSYNYDENGNITEVSNFNQKSDTFHYDTNDQLIQMIDTKGKNFDFEYNNTIVSRIKNGISGTGISNQVKYDSYGNPIVSRIVKNNNKELPDGLYKIRLKGTDQYLKIIDSKVKATPGCSHDFWQLEKQEDYYKISHPMTKKCLSVVEGQLYLTPFQEDYSLFKLTKNKNASYSIQLKAEEKSIKFDQDTLTVEKQIEDDYHFEFYLETEENLFIENSATYSDTGRFLESTTDELLHKTTYQVNPVTGLTESITNPKGQTTTYTYNEKEQLSSVTNKDKEVTYTYTENNLLDKIHQETKDYKFIYDDFLNTKQIKINDQTLVTNEYEEGNGNLVSVTYGNGDQVEYEYDEFDRVCKIIKQDDTYEYQYDNNGNLSKIISNRGITRFDYDIAKRLEQYKNNDFVIRYGYDYGDNVIKRTYQLNNQTKVIENTLNEDDAVTKTSFQENNVTYEYDDLGRLVKRSINDQNPIEYTYVTNGKRTSTILKTQKVGEDIYKYHYDALNNITRIYKNDILVHRYYYDDYNELIKEKNYSTNETITYTYDESGNLLSKKVYELNTNTLKDQNTYEYSNEDWEDQLTKFNNESITYDEIGNPLTIGNKTLTWENGRQLKKIEDQTNTIEYQYNNGIRTSKTVNNQKTDYYLEGNKIILEKREEDMIYYIRNEVDDLIGFEYQDQFYYYIKNIQNDIVGILDQEGNQVVTYTYDSWGNILEILDENHSDVSNNLTHIANINPFRYRSYYYDVETKLYYLNSRYYNPLWGRFLNADGVIGANGDLFSNNIYLYCSNNPVNYDDISGCWKIPKWVPKVPAIVAIVAVTAIITAAVIAAAPTIATVAVVTAANLGVVGTSLTTVGTVAKAATIGVGIANAANGASKVGEVITGTNVIRDVVMGGNEDVYDALDIGLTVLSAGIIATGDLYTLSPPQDTVDGRNSPKEGVPFSQSNFEIKDGTQIRFYDYNGNASLDIDFHPGPGHSNPHFHIWDHTNTKKPRGDFINKW